MTSKNKDIIIKKIEDEERLKKIEETTKKATRDMYMEYVPYLIIIFFVVITRIFVATPVLVNGSSMQPTLENKDAMLLYKLTKKTKGIKRFDVVVINTDSGKLIKRVIGLPGEKVTYRIEENEENKKIGVLYIDNKKINEKFLTEETKLNTCKEEWQICMEEVVVPEGEYFVMGDNRINSKDSRMIGTVEDKSISGIAKLRIYPFNKFGNVK